MAAKKRNWTQEEKKYVSENIGRLDINQIAQRIGRSPRAIRIFAHRQRISIKQQHVKTNHLLKMLTLKFIKPEYFTPTREFYNAVGITQMRYWSLYRGEATITSREHHAIRTHFQIPENDLVSDRQLNIFETERQ